MKGVSRVLVPIAIALAGAQSSAEELEGVWMEPAVMAPSGIASAISCTPLTFWRPGCGGLRLRERVELLTNQHGADVTRSRRTTMANETSK
ncbi:MAG: hypothetical protein AAF566_09125 [Pseudomonadota bacterium]